jgi:hypothetical protein
MNFFRIPDLGSGISVRSRLCFLVRFLNYLKNSCSFNFLLIRLAPQTISSKRKVGFIFNPTVYVHCTVGSGMKNLGIRNEEFRDLG